MFRWQRIMAVGLIGIALTALAQAAPPTKEEIAKAVQQLGDNDFSVRENAMVFLRKAGRAAEPALKEALKSTDVEVIRRAKEVLEDFKWGIYPDTPKNVLELIQRYRGANDTGTKLDAADQLTRLTTPGYTALLKIAAAEDNVELRQSLFHRVARGVSHIVADLLVEEQYDQVEELLELSLISQDEAAQRHFAAFLFLRKQLDAKIPNFKAQLAQPAEVKRAAEVLAQLYRAKGDFAAARDAADKAESPGLVSLFLMELGDWKELAKRSLADQDQPVESIGYRAAFQRLAGDQADYEKTTELLRKLANGDDPSNSWMAAKALFLNDRTGDAMDALVATKSYRPVFDVLAHQLKYGEALELAKKVAADHPQRFEIDLRRAQVLFNLGEKDAALQLFAKLADELEAKTDLVNLSGHRDLIKAEMRLGLTDLAFAHTARFLTRTKLDEITKQLLEELFPQQPASALIWWTGLRKKQAEAKAEETLATLRGLFLKKTAPAGFPNAADALEAYLPAGTTPPDKHFLALADACQALAKPDLEEAFLVKAAADAAADGSAQLRLADLLAAKKDWPAAADRFRLAWEKDKSKPLALFLHGWALTQAGKEEGKKRMEAAHWLPLASEQARFDFAGALADRGFQDDARRERDLILRSGAQNGWHANETLRMVAYDAMYRKDYARAAQLFEQFRLRCLRASVGFVQYSAYIQVPVLVHQNRALAALAAGKLDEAKQSMRTCLNLVPGNVDLPIRFVAELDRSGNKAEADDLFGMALVFLEKQVAQYPQGAAGHNTLAWLSASCRRQLDKGLEHAQKAVALAPGQAGYFDTLAEVYFQRGDKDKAIDTIRKCMELEPQTVYFQKQLKRFQAGDPKAELPEP